MDAARSSTRSRGAGARATFFVLAPRAAAHPALVERMLAEGHAVGLHAYAHVRHTELDARRRRRRHRPRAGRARARSASRPTLWRTPWGVDAPSGPARVAAAHGLRLVGWTADTHDWRGDRAEAMLAAIADDVDRGAIVLAHDGARPGRDARRLRGDRRR